MVASIGEFASLSQAVTCHERDGYYVKDDPAHREASAWANRCAEELGLSSPVGPEAFKAILKGEVPGGRQLRRKDFDGNIRHRPGRGVMLSAPKSVSLTALVSTAKPARSMGRVGGPAAFADPCLNSLNSPADRTGTDFGRDRDLTDTHQPIDCGFRQTCEGHYVIGSHQS